MQVACCALAVENGQCFAEGNAHTRWNPNTIQLRGSACGIRGAASKEASWLANSHLRHALQVCDVLWIAPRCTPRVAIRTACRTGTEQLGYQSGGADAVEGAARGRGV
eukprot:3161502-Rhodomonas_salina.3